MFIADETITPGRQLRISINRIYAAYTFGTNYILIFCIEELKLFDEIPIGLHDEAL